MIDGLGRGQQEGALKAREIPCGLADTEIQVLATARYIEMQQQGYAHIEPYEKFLQGYVQGFKEQRLLARAN
jgi:hypothetical protein